MDCIVRKLKASVNNANLPVFENVVIKNYITTTQNGQYIDLSDIFSNTKKVKMEVKYIKTSTSNFFTVLYGGVSYILHNKGYTRVYNPNEGTLVSTPADSEIHAGCDASDGSWFVGETTGSVTPPTSDYSGVFYVFARPLHLDESVAGEVRIKWIKLTTYATSSSDTPVEYILVPATVNGVACLFDQNRGTTYFEKNNGALVCG